MATIEDMMTLDVIKTMLAGLIRRFRIDTRGQIAIIFALSSTAIVASVGVGVDLSRAYMNRQKLSQVATLTCQFSNRANIVDIANNTASSNGANGLQTYLGAVNAFAATSLQSQNWSGPTPTPKTGNAGYFTATQASASNATAGSTAPTNPTVEMQASVPTLFMSLFHVSQVTVHTKVACLTAAATPQIDNPGTTSSPNPLLQESFETSCGYYCWTQPNGTAGTLATPTSVTPSTPSYTGSSGAKWYILGYCLETDVTGVINSTSPQGSHTAELDCDNGSGSAGNSSITTKAYLAAGHYELRYNYRGRVDYPNYDPTYICGSTAADVGWANDTTTTLGTASRTNQINVYLDMATSTSIPLHTTIDGAEQLGGSNLIDMCVYSPTWIERSVKITIVTPAYYWLSFAADGANDSFGGQLDNIRLCQETCLTSLQDNFPTSWLAANNGGVNKVLFEDGFESPVYTQDPYTTSKHSKGGNLAKSYGTTVTACTVGGSPVPNGSPPGWPCQASTGWAVAPYNQVVFWEQGATQGSQYFSLQGWNGFSNSSDTINRSVSRPFLLVPGFYNVSYNYASLVDFSYSFVYNNGYWPVCTANPTTADSYSTFGMKFGYDYANTSLVSQYLSTNFMNVYMASGQSVSTPIVNSTLGGAPTYNNPDGTTSSSPTVPMDNGTNFVSYSASAVNPVIDTCYYSQSYGWVARGINIKITKTGFYWLDFSAQGDPLTGLGAGPALDDVKLTALGSPYMVSPPTTSLATIPVPAPQPDTVYYGLNSVYNGFYIVADPFIPPAADL